ncbi:MAG: Stage V sporulation protein E [Candidatus Woesebacteria bacterium GW2011_GWA1_39_21]|uniref:Probable peptidoglycan glycosyltransferase FtsW n=1 Tax=Candidatus Woesebacteria bacterium GW2011_GWA1_39_21 TaxID=1618550 RepID=A0A0G0N6H0_9BACT|nr:MAG: Stage V sporulation protein E [Candidatus Woesebacteria bacterium GW2011_GWA1_39_21]
MKRKKASAKHLFFFIDYRLFIPLLVLILIGLFAIMDVSAPRAMEIFSDRFYFVKQQLVWVIVGLFVFLIISQINVTIWSKFALYIYLLSIIFLILVLIPGISAKTLGARRWLNLGFFGFQPSEFAKLALCIYLAKLAANKRKLISFLLPIILTSSLVMLQPDLGTTIVIGIIAFSQLVFSGVDLRKILIIGICAIVVVFLLIIMSDYRRERLQAFLNPITSDQSDNYHIKQILYSLAIGGVSGSGIGQSKQKYLFLPEATTDSIMAIVAEETGFLGVSIILGIYIFISLRMATSLKKVKDDFLIVLAIGISSWFTGQAFINLGSVSSLLPFTGVPLPFISYGGSTLLTMLTAFAIFNSVLKYSQRYEW